MLLCIMKPLTGTICGGLFGVVSPVGTYGPINLISMMNMMIIHDDHD